MPANNTSPTAFKPGVSGNPKGRPKGTPNKVSGSLKDAVLAAAEAAGGEGGTVGYLTQQAKDNPVAFMGLIGRVLPTQHEGPGEDGAHIVKIVTELVRPSPPSS